MSEESKIRGRNNFITFRCMLGGRGGDGDSISKSTYLKSCISCSGERMEPSFIEAGNRPLSKIGLCRLFRLRYRILERIENPLPPPLPWLAIRGRLTIREHRIIDPRGEHSSPLRKHDRAEIESRANSKSDSSIRILSTRFLDPCINRFERERERELKMLGEGKLAVKIRARENGRTETEKKERGLLFLGANF